MFVFVFVSGVSGSCDECVVVMVVVCGWRVCVEGSGDCVWVAHESGDGDGRDDGDWVLVVVVCVWMYLCVYVSVDMYLCEGSDGMFAANA